MTTTKYITCALNSRNKIVRCSSPTDLTHATWGNKKFNPPISHGRLTQKQFEEYSQ